MKVLATFCQGYFTCKHQIDYRLCSRISEIKAPSRKNYVRRRKGSQFAEARWLTTFVQGIQEVDWCMTNEMQSSSWLVAFWKWWIYICISVPISTCIHYAWLTTLKFTSILVCVHWMLLDVNHALMNCSPDRSPTINPTIKKGIYNRAHDWSFPRYVCVYVVWNVCVCYVQSLHSACFQWTSVDVTGEPRWQWKLV